MLEEVKVTGMSENNHARVEGNSGDDNDDLRS